MKFIPIFTLLLSRLETFLGTIAPRTLLRYRQAIGYGIEPELFLLPFLCNKYRVSIDIGANAGMYSLHMLKHSKMVYAFEPNPRYTKRLTRSFPSRFKLFPVALSNVTGISEMRIPIGINGAATLECANNFGGNYSNQQIEVMQVSINTLDEFNFREVGFIKMDVEGYEGTVLEGAVKTIADSRPAMLIEIEERHRPGSIRQVCDFLSTYGYKGYFLMQGRLRPIEAFNAVAYQSATNVGKLYINNFIFLTRMQKEGLIADLKDAGVQFVEDVSENA